MNIFEIAMERGMEKGMEKGLEQAKLDSATRLLDILSDDVIAEKLEIDIETVKELREKQNCK